jgi:hypothetical protein
MAKAKRFLRVGGWRGGHGELGGFRAASPLPALKEGYPVTAATLAKGDPFKAASESRTSRRRV